MKPIYVLNGPNLNLLGVREPHIYGHTTLAQIEAMCVAVAARQRVGVEFRQSNAEGDLIDWIGEARTSGCAIVINPAGYGCLSIALLDAVKGLPIPVVECHISNPLAREPFRRETYISLAATGVICGFGARSYELAIEAALGCVSRTG